MDSGPRGLNGARVRNLATWVHGKDNVLAAIQHLLLVVKFVLGEIVFQPSAIIYPHAMVIKKKIWPYCPLHP